MLHYSNYMKGARLKWKHLLFWYTLSCFDSHNQLELQVFKKICHLTHPLWVDGNQTPYWDEMEKKHLSTLIY
jgi:hypothetical protein